ncbi:beta strand repeat-containing protein [Roseomonas sp. CCTCC AB2023176]|uniref:beta strand repeat-containing protein n=1 Tax=Roseomonas sp. CCTCC AB2023176 TaxID=3342640 RepID=UPI0035E1EBCA
MAGIPSIIDLANITDDTRAARVDGAAGGDTSGISVASAGDVNGDGYADVLIGANRASPSDRLAAGSTTVLFGRADGFAEVDLANLSAADGFRVDGAVAFDFSGTSVASAGDVNGDGYADLVIGADNANPLGRSGAGSTTVLFGKAGGFADIDLANLSAADGFRVDGAAAFDFSGRSVASADDVNGDGYDDLVIGAYYASPLGRSNAGSSYVLFGKAGGFANVDLANLSAADGFRVAGAAAGDYSGYSVASAGDVNGDGYADIVIGAYLASPSGRAGAGSTYVLFGKAGGFADVDLANLSAADGFRVDGEAGVNGARGDALGVSVAGAGDLNGDGYADIVIGAVATDPYGRTQAGSTIVLFGKADGFANVDVANLSAADGFRVDGAAPDDLSGTSVASAGDVSGDGYDDLVIGAYHAAPSGRTNAGSSYVLFGKAGGFADVDLANLSAADGFRVDGAAAFDISGYSVASAGDLDGDGYADLLVGASEFSPAERPAAGRTTVLYGEPTEAVSRTAGGFRSAAFGGDFGDTLTGTDADNELVGRDGDDSISGGLGADTLRGDGGNDTLEGGAGADSLDGGDGNDIVSYAGATARVEAGLGGGFTSGDADGDVLVSVEGLIGSAFGDRLEGGSGAETLDGGAGDDVLFGSAGADTLIGGAGTDLAFYNQGGAVAITVDLAAGTGRGGIAEGDVLSGIENVITGGGDDRLTGNAADNFLNGEGGADTLVGGAGADTLQGSTSLFGGDSDWADYSSSGAGVTVNLAAGTGSGGDAEGDVLIVVENLVGSAFADVLTGTDGANTLLSGEGNDTLEGGAGADSLDGAAGAGDVASFAGAAGRVAASLGGSPFPTAFGDALGDTFTGIEGLIGSAFGDSLGGSEGAETLDGGGGDDFLYGTTGADRLVGGAGTDTVLYEPSGIGVTVSLATGTGTGGLADGDVLVGIENLRGSGADDRLEGDAGDNRLDGSRGSDTLIGGAGADTLMGSSTPDGAEVDVADYSTSGAGVTVSLATGRGTGGDAEGDVLQLIRSLAGSAFADVLTGDPDANLLSGAGGNDLLLGGAGADTLLGGEGADTLEGGAGADSIDGGGGADVLSGGTGVDSLAGGAGDDTYVVEDAGDVVTEAPGGGFDVLYVSVTATLPDNVEALVVIGTAAVNLTGGAGDDVLVGNEAANVLAGGAGNDNYSVNGSVDTIVEEAGGGIDAVYSTADLTLPENVEVLVLLGAAVYGTGNAGDNVVLGNAADNILSGGAGYDVLEGGAGADILIGGNGPDALTGGAGADLFRFEGLADAFAGAVNTGDTLLDFTPGEDRIQLNAAAFGLTGVVPGVTFVSADVPFAATTAPTLLYSGATGGLFHDANGTEDGGLTLLATLVGRPALSAADFAFY